MVEQANTVQNFQFEFIAEDARALHEICGRMDSPVYALEEEFDVKILVRDATVRVFGAEEASVAAAKKLQGMIARKSSGESVDVAQVRRGWHDDEASNSGDVERGDFGPREVVRPRFAGPRARMGSPYPTVRSGEDVSLHFDRKKVEAKNDAQAAYLQAIANSDITFGVGPAGTGKTFLAVAMALHALEEGFCRRLIFTRPAVEAGEKLGFLPGDMADKVSPYMRPLYDALFDLAPRDRVERMIKTGQVEIAPLAFMRGRTLNRAVVILDEAQNTTPSQMKMLLTRLGEGSKAIVCGDATQNDLPSGSFDGLTDAIQRLSKIRGCSVVHFGAKHVVRSDIVSRILAVYE